MSELVAKAEMLIRRPAEEAFDAFVQPELITKFWLKSASGPLRKGAQVDWEFLVRGATERVLVTASERPGHLAFEWTKGKLNVDIRLSEAQKGSAVVRVQVRGFEEGEDSLAQVVNATEGFSIVLCDLKTFLESGRSAHLVQDKAALIQSQLDA